MTCLNAIYHSAGRKKKIHTLLLSMILRVLLVISSFHV